MDGDLKNLLSINELSKISGISRKNILYMEKIKLIIPDYINEETKYRYYNQDKIYLLEIIKHLKKHGLEPSEIKDFLLKDINLVIKQLKQKKKFFLEEAERVKKNIIRIDSLIDTFESSIIDKKNEYFFNIKEEEERLIFYKRFKSPFDAFSLMWRVNDLTILIEKNNINFIEPFISIFYDDYSSLDISDVDYALCIRVTHNEKESDQSNFQILPKGLYASTVHIGNYETSIKAYNFLINNIEKKGYRIIGPTLKIYLLPLNPLAKTELVSELQIQIEKK